MKFRCQASALALVFLVSPAQAELKTAEEIDACYQANFPETTAIQTISMNAKDRIGAITTTKSTLWWKKMEDGKSNVMMQFFKPAEMRNAGLLMLERDDGTDIFIYLPELARVKRVTSRMTSSSMFGTDFSYEEFERLQGIAESAPSERLPDDTIEGRPAYVLETRPGPEDDSAYERIKTWIDKETCVSLKSEFYERGDKPRKVMFVRTDKITREGNLWVPREIVMHDHRDETETVMVVEKIEIGVDISRSRFSQSQLERTGR